MSELYDPNQDLSKICQSEFFAPEPEKLVVNGKGDCNQRTQKDGRY